MEITRDYLPAVKLPIIAILALFVILTLLVTSINLFTELETADPEIYRMLVGGIYFAFTISIWEIIIWAGIRTARATQGSLIDGAIGGVVTAVVAGFITRLISIVFKISILPVIASAPEPSSAAAAWIAQIIAISLDVVGLVLWLFVDLVGGAVLGGVGGLVHKRKLIDQMDRY